MKVFNDTNFAQQVLQSVTPVVVDFWSTGCGKPCSDTQNMLAGLQPLYPSIVFGTLLTDTNPVTTAQYAITVLPSVLIFQNGLVVNRFNGEPTQIEMIEALNALKLVLDQVAG
jgi:thioredoxin 1